MLLRVRAYSLNYHDIFTRRSMPGIKVPLPCWRRPKTEPHFAWPDILPAASAMSSIAATPDHKLQTAHAISETAWPAAPLLAAMANWFRLHWSAYARLPSVQHQTARQFYIAEALRGRWSARQLDRRQHACRTRVLATEHWTASPDEEVLAAALGKTRQLPATAKPGTKR